MVSAFLKPRSKPARVLRLALQGELTIVCNEAILSEYLEVLGRPKFELKRKRVEKTVQFMRFRGMHALAQPLNLPDHSDEPFLEAALATGVDMLGTDEISSIFRKRPARGSRLSRLPNCCDCWGPTPDDLSRFSQPEDSRKSRNRELPDGL